MSNIAAIFEEAATLVSSSGLRASDYDTAADAEILRSLTVIAQLRDEVDKHAAFAAAAIARHSDRALGQSGLAQRNGFITPTAMVQSILHGTKQDTNALLRAGATMAESEAAADLQAHADAALERGEEPLAPVQPVWFAALGAATAAGQINTAIASALRTGLGEPNERVSSEALAGALGELLDNNFSHGHAFDADQALKAARLMRDRVDSEGIVARADAMRRRQYLRVWAKPDGMVHGSFAVDPMNGALMVAVYEQLRHPRHAGVRFVADDQATPPEAAEGLPGIDEATAEGFMELIRAGMSVNPDEMLQEQRAAVRLVVTEEAIAHFAAAETHDCSGEGCDDAGCTGHASADCATFDPAECFGMIEGSNEPVPLGAVAREMCSSGFIPILFDADGSCLNLGRERRRFSTQQKKILAARDGGCQWPGCTRPPSRTEAHHIEQWARDNGKTDIADGILLCRPHHLLLHNQGWEIVREGSVYWLIPPPAIDPSQRRIRLLSKSVIGPAAKAR